MAPKVGGAGRLPAILVMTGILAALAVGYAVLRRPQPVEQPEPRRFLWSVEMDELKRMIISLPAEQKSDAWVKHEDEYWYFDEPGGPRVDMKRWGGGVPLLLSGPGLDRPIADDATDEQLEVYGFRAPAVRIELTLESDRIIKAEVGGPTPDGRAYYIKLLSLRDVYAVDHTWVDVLQRLVREPPYPEPPGK